jgi:hypothetical protein
LSWTTSRCVYANHYVLDMPVDNSVKRHDPTQIYRPWVYSLYRLFIWFQQGSWRSQIFVCATCAIKERNPYKRVKIESKKLHVFAKAFRFPLAWL